jgi:7,8-dihydropterin-6-yl-methyl-4-(beta-D-ribofuranosyl)aminobenzene 5'-phosphate synthase
MLADARGVGEWGFAALVEADGRRLLFDTGARPGTVLANFREPGVDLAGVTDVALSHHHGDHTGGLLAPRRELVGTNPEALSRAYSGPASSCPAPAMTAGRRTGRSR